MNLFKTITYILSKFPPALYLNRITVTAIYVTLYRDRTRCGSFTAHCTKASKQPPQTVPERSGETAAAPEITRGVY